MLGQVVVYDQHIPATVHEVFAQRASGIGRDILQRGRIAGGGGHYDGIVHGVAAAQRFHQLCHRGRLLSDGHIDADDILPLLVQDGIQCDGGLSRLAVTDDQLSLATANGEHGVDGQNARLQRLIHRLAVNDTRGRGLHRIVVLRRDLTGVVYGLAQRVDHTAQKALAHRRARHLSGAAHHTALHDLAVVAKDHAADLGFPQIQDHALQSAVKQQYLAVFRSGKPTDCGDPVAHRQHGAYLIGMGCRFKAPDGLPHQWHHIAMAADSLRHLLLQLAAFACGAPVIDLIQLPAVNGGTYLDAKAVVDALVLPPHDADGLLVLLFQKRPQTIQLLLRRLLGTVKIGFDLDLSDLMLRHASVLLLHPVQEIIQRRFSGGRQQLIHRLSHKGVDLRTGLSQHSGLLLCGFPLRSVQNGAALLLCLPELLRRGLPRRLHSLLFQRIGLIFHVGQMVAVLFLLAASFRFASASMSA